MSETRRYERYITTDLDPVVALPGLIAVGLDTMPAWRWKSGHVSPRQAEIVRDAFEGAPTEAWRLLVTHHPVLPEEGSRLVGRRILLKACAHAGVAVLLSGHTHVASMNVVPLDERGRHWAVAVGSGTTLSHRTRGTPNAYGVLHLSNATGIGASVTLDIRQAEGTDWSVAAKNPVRVHIKRGGHLRPELGVIGSPLLLHLTILSLSVQPHLQFLTGGAASPLHAATCPFMARR